MVYSSEEEGERKSPISDKIDNHSDNNSQSSEYGRYRKRSKRNRSRSRDYGSRRRQSDRENFESETHKSANFQQSNLLSKTVSGKEQERAHYTGDIPNNTIIIRNLPLHIVESDIQKDIEKVGGSIKEIRLMRYKETGLSRGFAFVEYFDVEDAKKLYEYANRGYIWIASQYKAFVNFSAPRALEDPAKYEWICSQCGITNYKKRPQCFKCNLKREESDIQIKIGKNGIAEMSAIPNKVLLFRGLDPYSTTEDRLIETIRMYTYAPMAQIKMGKDPSDPMNTTHSMGFCLIEMLTVKDACDFMRILTNNLIYNCDTLIQRTVDTKDSSTFKNGILLLDNDSRRVLVSFAKSKSALLGLVNATVATQKERVNCIQQGVRTPLSSFGNRDFSNGLGITPGLIMQTAQHKHSMYMAHSALQHTRDHLSASVTGIPLPNYQNYYDYDDPALSINPNDKSKTTPPQPLNLFPLPSGFGNESLPYPIPDTSLFQYEATSGYYYDPITRLYYDSNSKYFYNGETQKYLYWDECKRNYFLIPSTLPSTLAPTPSSSISESSSVDSIITANAVTYTSSSSGPVITEPSDMENEKDKFINTSGDLITNVTKNNEEEEEFPELANRDTAEAITRLDRILGETSDPTTPIINDPINETLEDNETDDQSLLVSRKPNDLTSDFIKEAIQAAMTNHSGFDINLQIPIIPTHTTSINLLNAVPVSKNPDDKKDVNSSSKDKTVDKKKKETAEAKRIAREMERWAKNQNVSSSTSSTTKKEVTTSTTTTSNLITPVQNISSVAEINIQPTIPISTELIKNVSASLIDENILACLLCKRQFQSKEVLQKHVMASQLHKDNIAKYIQINPVVQPTLLSTENKADSTDVEIGEWNDSMPKYRDRAKERREKYGTDAPEPPPISNQLAKMIKNQMAAAITRPGKSVNSIANSIKEQDKAISDDNLGSKMLKNMGWKSGSGLGKRAQGIVEPIRVIETKKFAANTSTPIIITQTLNNNTKNPNS